MLERIHFSRDGFRRKLASADGVSGLPDALVIYMKQAQNLVRLSLVGLVWGVLWAALALVAGAVIGAIDPADIDPGEEPIMLAPIVAMAGFICGVAFGALMSAFQRRNWVLDGSLTRVLAGGALVGMVLSCVTRKVVPELFITAPLGAFSAIVSVGIVRKWTAFGQSDGHGIVS